MKGSHHTFTDASAVPLHSALDLESLTSALTLPKHHLLTLFLLGSGGSRMGSSSGGRQVKQLSNKLHVNSMKVGK